MKLKILVILTAISSVIAGCATIVSGTTQQVTFQSTPEGAIVKVNGKPLGKTPLTIQLDKEDGLTLTIEKEGYKTFTTSMDTTLDSWFWGNILIGGVLGSTTDGISGAINEYSPGQYFITLNPEYLSHKGPIMHLSQLESARRFLFINYQKLKSEFSKNSGEAINATLDILNIEPRNHMSVTDDIKNIMFKYDDPADFVNITLNKYFESIKT